MLYRQGNEIFYKSTCTTALVDTITPRVIIERMVAAKFSPIFATFIAYNGGMVTRDDAIRMGKTVLKNGKALIE